MRNHSKISCLCDSRGVKWMNNCHLIAGHEFKGRHELRIELVLLNGIWRPLNIRNAQIWITFFCLVKSWAIEERTGQTGQTEQTEKSEITVFPFLSVKCLLNDRSMFWFTSKVPSVYYLGLTFSFQIYSYRTFSRTFENSLDDSFRVNKL